MNIEKAKRLQVGARVSCPADRGDAPFIGTVESVGSVICHTLDGTEYVWVTVRPYGGLASVWPSNRIN